MRILLLLHGRGREAGKGERKPRKKYPIITHAESTLKRTFPPFCGQVKQERIQEWKGEMKTLYYSIDPPKVWRWGRLWYGGGQERIAQRKGGMGRRGRGGMKREEVRLLPLMQKMR